MNLTPDQCLQLLHRGANELRDGNLTAAGQLFSAAVESAKQLPKEQSYAPPFAKARSFASSHWLRTESHPRVQKNCQARRGVENQQPAPHEQHTFSENAILMPDQFRPSC